MQVVTGIGVKDGILIVAGLSPSLLDGSGVVRSSVLYSMGSVAVWVLNSAIIGSHLWAVVFDLGNISVTSIGSNVGDMYRYDRCEMSEMGCRHLIVGTSSSSIRGRRQ